MRKVFIIVCSLFFPGVTNADPLPTTSVISLEIAESIAKKAYENCKEEGVTPSVSIVDQQGTLLFFMRGKDTGPHTSTTSFRKAYTAASLQMPTSFFAPLADLPKLSQLAKMSDDILLLTGGLPITYDDVLVGGIGMSGAPSPELEEECASNAIKEILK